MLAGGLRPLPGRLVTDSRSALGARRARPHATPFAQQHLKFHGPPNSGRSVAEWAPSLKKATDACVLASNNASPAQRGPRRDAQPLHATPLAAVLFPARGGQFLLVRYISHFVHIVHKEHKGGTLGQLKLSTRSAASAGAECAGLSAPAPCTRPAAGTAPSRPTADRPAAPAQACDRRRSKATAGCGLLPCPVTRCALARPPHCARRARLLAAAAARPAPPRLPPS